MTSFTSFVIGMFVSRAFAETLDKAGAGANGVDAMWASICSVMPCSVPTGNLVTYLSLRIINFIFPFISVVAVILIIYSGILIITSNGSEDKVSEGKKIIMYAGVGLVLSLLTTAILNFFVGWITVLLS